MRFIFRTCGSCSAADQFKMMTVDEALLMFLLLVLFLFSRPAEQHLARVTVVFVVLFGIGMNIYEWGLFSHNVLDERFLLLGLALLASMVTSARTRHAESAQPGWAPTSLGMVMSS